MIHNAYLALYHTSLYNDKTTIPEDVEDASFGFKLLVVIVLILVIGTLLFCNYYVVGMLLNNV